MRRSMKKGFTLIELLIVVVIIGILAAVAIPKFSNTKQRASRSAGIADMRNLATAQEGFFADSSRYAAIADTGTGGRQDELHAVERKHRADAGCDGDGLERPRDDPGRTGLRHFQWYCSTPGGHAGHEPGRRPGLLVIACAAEFARLGAGPACFGTPGQVHLFATARVPCSAMVEALRATPF